MLNDHSYYKSTDFLNENVNSLKKDYFNLFGYNFESTLKDKKNYDLVLQKSKTHIERNKKIK